MFIALISFFGSIVDFLLNNVLAITGGIGTVLMAVVIWFSKKYLVPYLQLESRRKYARYIADIADDITDDLVRRYPGNKWLNYIDEAVDKIIEICSIDDEVARRAISAAINRK